MTSKTKASGSVSLGKSTAAMAIRMVELPHCHTSPKQGSLGAAAWDLYAAGPASVYTIFSHRTEIIPTGIALELPEHFCGLILPRSGLASSRLVTVANSPGLIDPDYRGEIKVALTLNSPSPHETYEVQAGDRIAQLLVVPYTKIDWQVVESISETERGAAGFGSTGK